MLNAVTTDNALREPALAETDSTDPPAKRRPPAQAPSTSSRKPAFLPDAATTATAMVVEPATGSDSAKEMLETAVRRSTSEMKPPTPSVPLNATTAANAMEREPAKTESAPVRPEALAMANLASMVALAPTEFASAKLAGKVLTAETKTLAVVLTAPTVVLAAQESASALMDTSVTDAKTKTLA